MNVKKRMLTGFGAMLMAGQVSAATVFEPTDGNVNFLADIQDGGMLAMFDDDDQDYLGSFITIPLSSIVGISGPTGTGDYIAVNEIPEVLVLSGSDHFILGFSHDGINWMSEQSVDELGANSYIISFGAGVSIVQVDVQAVPQVPVPPAAWLFGSGLLGLVGIARRKSHV